MIVNCPKCHLCYDRQTGKHYTCSCGAEFIVDESGKVILLPSENPTTGSCAPTPEEGSLASLSLDELKRMKLRSTYLVQWGWLTGIICLLWGGFTFVAFTISYKFIDPSFDPTIALVVSSCAAGVLVVTGFVNWYIYTRCRTEWARRFVCFDSSLMMIYAICYLLYSLWQNKNFDFGFSFVAVLWFVIVFGIGFFIFQAAKCKLLWGKSHFAHADVKMAYLDKRAGRDISCIKPTERADSPVDNIFVFSAFFLRISSLVLALAGIIISGGFKMPVAKNQEQAILEAAKKGDAKAQLELGMRSVKEKDYAEAVKWFRKAADKGNAEAQCMLGVCYAKGQGVEKDPKQAVGWYRKAADQGQKEAQGNLAQCYTDGQGVPKDLEKAVYWSRKAADQGNANAQNNLGAFYAGGIGGLPKDEKEAVKWYRKAADQGLKEAQYNLGVCYENGQGVTQDYTEALKWYRKAADQGQAMAQFSLGACYLQGIGGLPKDEKEAERLFKQSIPGVRELAEKGNMYAQTMLGGAYLQGIGGLPKDEKLAVFWYRKAADQGLKEAQFALGVCYANGLGLPKDLEQAVKWYRKAADQGDEDAKQALKELGY